MKKSFWLLIVFMPLPIFGQYSKGKNTIGFELLGSADIYALTFERDLNKNFSFQIGVSWVPGTWQLNGLNDRSFLYFPLELRLTKHTKYFFWGVSLGSIQTLLMNKNSSNDLLLRPQIGVYLGFKIGKRIKLNSELYFKSPYELALSNHQAFAYSRQKWLLWPGAALSYSF